MLKLKREYIFQPLQIVIGVVERRHTVPILSHVLIHIIQNKLTVIATDLEVELSASVMLEDTVPDITFTLPGRKLYDICKSLPEGAMIDFHFEEHKIIIKCNKSRFNLSRLVSDKFPVLEKENIQVETDITKESLHFLLENTYFCMAQQDVRYYLNGMLLECAPDKITAVSADGHRMALAWQHYAMHVTEEKRVIMPRKGVSELMRLLSGSNSDQINLKVGNHHIHFSTAEFTLSSKLIDGKFPDYQRALPRKGDKTVIIQKDLFKDLLQRVSILLDKNRSILIELTENQLKAIVSNAEQEGAEEDITVEYVGEPLTLGFNVNYLSDLVTVIKSKTFQMTLSDSNTAVLVEEVENPQVLFLIMPMKI